MSAGLNFPSHSFTVPPADSTAWRNPSPWAWISEIESPMGIHQIVLPLTLTALVSLVGSGHLIGALSGSMKATAAAVGEDALADEPEGDVVELEPSPAPQAASASAAIATPTAVRDVFKPINIRCSS